MIFFKSNKKGFTLIELLVVISIIGILASVVLSSVSSAKTKTRDSKRKQDMIQLRTALELYRGTNGSYPLANTGGWGGVNVVPCGAANGTVSGASAYISGLTPNFISALPVDPSPIQWTCNGYLYISDGANYKVLSHNIYEGTYPSAGQTFYDPLRPTWSLMLTSKTDLPPGTCSSIQWIDSAQLNTYGSNWPACW